MGYQLAPSWLAPVVGDFCNVVVSLEDGAQWAQKHGVRVGDASAQLDRAARFGTVSGVARDESDVVARYALLIFDLDRAWLVPVAGKASETTTLPVS